MKLHHWRLKACRKDGFTLIELLVVLVLLAWLFLGSQFIGGRRPARSHGLNAAKIEMHGIKAALQSFEHDTSRYPTTAEGLTALIVKPSDLAQDRWTGPYISKKSAPKDAYGMEYEYICPSEHGDAFDLISAGPDKTFGTDDDLSLFEEGTKPAR